MFFNQQGLTTAQFLHDYWQQQPLLLRQAFPAFEPELDANDIAGLACDELAESRLVTGRFEAADWRLRYGPFSEEDLAGLPDRDWTLLVQDVDKHYLPLQTLLGAFTFLPRWRIDDLMASVAAPGGSVGPHVDQYDVFLLQAAGRRRWEIATDYEPDLLPDCELNVLRRFESQQAWDLEPGDMLYLPPGVAHHGIALGTPGTADGTASLCMTWSIGMRAPSAADLLQALGEWLAARPGEGGRYRDPGLAPPARSGEIDDSAFSGLQDLARSAIDDAGQFATFLGAFLSGYRLAQEPAPPPHSLEPAALLKLLRRGARLRHHPWTRLVWLDTPGGTLLFAAGARFACDADLAVLICDPGALGAAPPEQLEADAPLLCALINRGHLVIETI